jgi:hypothetical protein
MPTSVELRYSPARVAARAVFLGLLAVIPTILLASFLMTPLLQAAFRIGETPLLLGGVVCVALFTLARWWHAKTFVLRADKDGVYQAVGWSRRSVRWSEVSYAEVEEPTDKGGHEYIDSLAVFLRDGRGRTVLSLGRDLGGGLPDEQVAAFKRFVIVRLIENEVPRIGTALAWINWV